MPGSSRATGMTRTPERFAFVVLMLCLVATWAGVIPFEMRQVFIAYLIFWAERVDFSRMVARYAKRANAAADNA
jgi:hypothetical protein